MPNQLKTHEKLRELRTRTDLKLKPLKHLKATFTDFSGQERPLSIRYYQVQGVLHLVMMRRFLLGDDTGLGKCTSYRSRILTDRGLLTLGDIAPKNISLTPDTFYPLDQPLRVWTGWGHWAPVKSFYSCGIKPTITVRTRRGYETTGSLVHPLWMRCAGGESFVKLGEARIGDFLALDLSEVAWPLEEPAVPLPDPSCLSANATVYHVPDKLTPDLAALLGYVVAEGWTNTRMGILISQDNQRNPEVHAHIRSLCLRTLGWIGNEGAKSKETTIDISSTYLRAYFQGLGVGLGLSATKRVPWPIFAASQDSMAAFLRAFFDGEGSVTGDVLEVSSASEKLLEEIQLLLLRFGIVASRHPKKVPGRERLYWRLSICGDAARMFDEQIGFLTPRKQEALDKLRAKRANPNLDVIPHAQSSVERLRIALLKVTSRSGANTLRKGSGLKQFGISFEKTLNNIRNGGRNPTYAFLQRLLKIARQVGVETSEGYHDVETLCRNHFFYDPIVAIEHGREKVADLEVDDPSHSFVADGFINHNTLEAILALCYLWEQDPNIKVVVLTTKSATRQWANEFSKFTRGIRVIVGQGPPAARNMARRLFEQSTGPTVFITGYRTAVQDFRAIQPWKDYILICDEATVFKNTKTQVHQVCKYMADVSSRCWGLTATLIKNHLMEGYGVFKVVVPDLFPMTERDFMFYYAITRLQTVARGRQVPIIVGYLPQKIAEFRREIDAYYLGRAKHEVASELPALLPPVILEVDMTPAQETKYKEALEGLLRLRDEKKEEVAKQVSELTAITYCQEISNSLDLIGIEDPDESPKIQAIIDLLTEGDFADAKVIIFTRFRKMIDLLMPVLAKAKIKAVRITGSENDRQRETAKMAFLNPDDPTRVVCITTAGSEAINLQAANLLICLDTPWSAGDFLQLLGRMIRIGSEHTVCHVVHLVARSDLHPKTVDHRVLQVLGKKMNLIEAALGRRFKGDRTPMVLQDGGDIHELFASLREDALKGTKRPTPPSRVQTNPDSSGLLPRHPTNWDTPPQATDWPPKTTDWDALL